MKFHIRHFVEVFGLVMREVYKGFLCVYMATKVMRERDINRLVSRVLRRQIGDMSQLIASNW